MKSKIFNCINLECFIIFTKELIYVLNSDLLLLISSV